MATHSSTLAWKIPRTGELGGLQSMGSQRVGHYWVTSLPSFHLLHTLSLEKEMATHSNILAWRIPWMEEPGGPQSTGSQRVRHDFTFTFTFNYLEPVFCFPPESPQGVQSGVVGVMDGLMVTASFVVWHGRQHSLSTLCPTWVIQNICPILKSITNSYLQSPFLPYKVTLTFWGFEPLGPSGALLQLITSRNILLLVSHRFKSSEHQLYDVEQNH